jgi:hypothetical protein
LIYEKFLWPGHANVTALRKLFPTVTLLLHFTSGLYGGRKIVLRLLFPVHSTLLVSVVIAISIRSRVHNASLLAAPFLQEVTDGKPEGTFP